MLGVEYALHKTLGPRKLTDSPTVGRSNGTSQGTAPEPSVTQAPGHEQQRPGLAASRSIGGQVRLAVGRHQA